MMNQGSSARRLGRTGSGFWVQALYSLCAVLLSVPAVRAQSTLGTDFEFPSSYSLSSDARWLSWNLVAPGWRHAPGANTLFIVRDLDTSSTTQCYFLVDSSSTQSSPLAGRYSLGFSSGHYSSLDPNSPWTPAYIEQDCVVPGDAKSFSMLAAGDFSLSFNSRPIEVANLGGNCYGADVSSFAGQSVTIRIGNTSSALLNPVIVDGLSFSPTAVPEPAPFQLMLCGFLLLIIVLKARREHSESSARHEKSHH